MLAKNLTISKLDTAFQLIIACKHRIVLILVEVQTASSKRFLIGMQANESFDVAKNEHSRTLAAPHSQTDESP